MDTIELVANAKINLALAIKFKRPDGYHELESIFQEIDLSDHLIISKYDGTDFSTDSEELKKASGNICIRAVQLLQQDFSIPGLRIVLKKKIPIGGGLGGGSSDAAAVLRGACKLYGLNPNSRKVNSIAQNLGADVPFFLSGKTAYVSGIGELLKPIEIKTDYYILLVIPEVSISTVWAYKNLNFTLTSESTDYKFRGFRFQNLGLKDFRAEFFNDFENSVFKAYPQLEEVKARVYQTDAAYAAMSGSGAVIFGLYPTQMACSLARDSLKKHYRCIMTRPVISGA